MHTYCEIGDDLLSSKNPHYHHHTISRQDLALASQSAEKPQMASILGTNLIQPLIQKGELVSVSQQGDLPLGPRVIHPVADLIS